MRKTNRLAMCALAVAVSCMFAGCTNTAQQAESDDASAQQTVQGGTTPVTADATTLDGIVDAIENDFETTETDITTKLDESRQSLTMSKRRQAAPTPITSKTVACLRIG